MSQEKEGMFRVRRSFLRPFSLSKARFLHMDIKKVFPNIHSRDQKPNLICYHGNCPDGFGAAFCAWKVTIFLLTTSFFQRKGGKNTKILFFSFFWFWPFLFQSLGENATYVPCSYGDEVPDCKGKIFGSFFSLCLLLLLFDFNSFSR